MNTLPSGAADPPLQQGLLQVARELHQQLRALGYDERLARLAGSDVPEACDRLDYVVRVSEHAAHQTLDIVDEARAVAADLQLAAAELQRVLPELPEAQRERVRLAGVTVTEDADALRSKLTRLAQAQEYQDVSGQVIRQVIGLVRNVEHALLDLLRSNGVLPSEAPRGREPGGLAGPAVPGVVKGASQSDADDLLSSLGL